MLLATHAERLAAHVGRSQCSKASRKRIIEGRIHILGQTLKTAGWNDGDVQKAMADAREAGNVNTLKRQVEDTLRGLKGPRDMRHFENLPHEINEEGERVYRVNGQYLKAVVKTAWEGRGVVVGTEDDDSTPSQSFRR